MEDRKEKNAPWLSVPQFGDWDQKGPLPDYSLDFSKIREMRKQNKEILQGLVLVLKKISSIQLLRLTTKQMMKNNILIKTTLQLKLCSHERASSATSIAA
ncbi:RPM1-interacting protein 4 [Bienertia sinuspersici]